jgi:hypothetical protein
MAVLVDKGHAAFTVTVEFDKLVIGRVQEGGKLDLPVSCLNHNLFRKQVLVLHELGNVPLWYTQVASPEKGLWVETGSKAEIVGVQIELAYMGKSIPWISMMPSLSEQW